MDIDSNRDIALDITKGLCVLVMIFHHCIDHYSSGVLSLGPFRFVSGAFLFMAGWVSTHIYSAKQKEGISFLSLGSRLIIRGIKLFIIYSIINLGMYCVIGRAKTSNAISLSDFIYKLYFMGDYKNAYFALLLPISYLLIMIGVITAFPRAKNILLIMLACISVVYCCIVHYEQASGFFIRYLSIGILGALCGLLQLKVIRAICSKHLTVAICFITWLIISKYMESNYLVYIVNVIMTLLFLYSLSMHAKSDDPAYHRFLQWGNYTLIGYIGQIAIIYATKPLIYRIGFNGMHSLLAILFTTILLGIAIWLIDRLRKRYYIINQSYKILFS